MKDGKIYNYKPKTHLEFRKLVDYLLEARGYEADLNDIDTSLITDMVETFRSKDFNGDISNWDASNVFNMGGMFLNSKFDRDISGWKPIKLTCLNDMFSYSALEQNNKIPLWYKLLQI